MMCFKKPDRINLPDYSFLIILSSRWILELVYRVPYKILFGYWLRVCWVYKLIVGGRGQASLQYSVLSSGEVRHLTSWFCSSRLLCQASCSSPCGSRVDGASCVRFIPGCLMVFGRPCERDLFSTLQLVIAGGEECCCLWYVTFYLATCWASGDFLSQPPGSTPRQWGHRTGPRQETPGFSLLSSLSS